jgi:hypothetical protein
MRDSSKKMRMMRRVWRDVPVMRFLRKHFISTLLTSTRAHQRMHAHASKPAKYDDMTMIAKGMVLYLVDNQQ